MHVIYFVGKFHEYVNISADVLFEKCIIFDIMIYVCFETNITDCERLACWPRVASSWKYTGLESLSGNPVSFRLTAPVCVNLLPPAVTRKWQQIKNDVYTNPINLLSFNQKAYLLHYKHDVYELTLWSQRDCNISWWTCSFEICLYK